MRAKLKQAALGCAVALDRAGFLCVFACVLALAANLWTTGQREPQDGGGAAVADLEEQHGAM